MERQLFQLFPIIPKYSQLFPIIPKYSQVFLFQSTHEFFRFFAWLLCCDYCDYSPTIISIIFFLYDYFDYCDYSRLFRLFFSAAIISIIYFGCDYFNYYYYLRLFPIISIIPIIPDTNQHIRNNGSNDAIFRLPIQCWHVATQFITYHGTIPWPTCWHTKYGSHPLPSLCCPRKRWDMPLAMLVEWFLCHP